MERYAPASRERWLYSLRAYLRSSNRFPEQMLAGVHAKPAADAGGEIGRQGPDEVLAAGRIAQTSTHIHTHNAGWLSPSSDEEDVGNAEQRELEATVSQTVRTLLGEHARRAVGPLGDRAAARDLGDACAEQGAHGARHQLRLRL